MRESTVTTRTPSRSEAALSPYNAAGARLVDNGYSAIPVMPGTKRPGHFSLRQWRGASQWQRYCERLPTDLELAFWSTWPDAGVCVAIDHRLKVIDIDTDDPELLAAVLAVVPDSGVKKRGAKGFSGFYQGSAAIVSAPFSVGDERVVDLLCFGRQTVLPPTLHSTTGLPYHWITDDTLLDVSIDQLPVLPDDIAELLAGALERFGYVPAAEYTRGEGDSLWSEINSTALNNFSAWVPDLGLPGLYRSGDGYRAIAKWRDVTNANLSFHRDGIKDWGNDESHSPIDVVMKVLGVDLHTATNFLAERLRIHQITANDGFDVAAFIERQKNNALQRTFHV